MTWLLWCVVIGCALPYVAHGFVVREKLRTGTYDRHQPRAQAASLEGLGARAWAAQQNAWEAIAVFAPVALISHLVGGDSRAAGAFGVVWVAFRLAHLGAYLADKGALRSLMFGGANLCVLGLLVRAAMV